MRPAVRTVRWPGLLALLLASLAGRAQAQDLAITSMRDDRPMSIIDGALPPTPTPLVHTLVVTNHGPGGVLNAVVSDVATPPGDFGSAWRCVASGGSCADGSGSQLSASVSLQSGGTATFTVYVYFDFITKGFLDIRNTAQVQPLTPDPNPGNNTRTLWSYTIPSAGATRYYAITPCRLIDTRDPAAPFRGGESRNLPIAGLCGIPADAQVVAVNITAVDPTDSGNLRLYPGGRWSVTSALNFTAGRTRANTALVRLGQGAMGVQCDMLPRSTGQTHLVIDAYGYLR
jgi:hypothetical protein